MITLANHTGPNEPTSRPPRVTFNQLSPLAWRIVNAGNEADARIAIAKAAALFNGGGVAKDARPLATAIAAIVDHTGDDDLFDLFHLICELRCLLTGAQPPFCPTPGVLLSGGVPVPEIAKSMGLDVEEFGELIDRALKKTKYLDEVHGWHHRSYTGALSLKEAFRNQNLLERDRPSFAELEATGN